MQTTLPTQRNQWEMFLAFMQKQLDPTPIFVPFSQRKILLWSVYLTVICLTHLLVGFNRIWNKLKDESDTIHSMTVTVTIVEFSVFALAILFSKYPLNVVPQEDTLLEENYRKNSKVAILIACHESRNEIAETVKSWLKVVRPEQIYLMHNHSTPTPPDDTEAVAKAIHPNIKYFYEPLRSKTKALFMAVEICIEKGDIEYVVLADDDTLAPKNWRIETELLVDENAAILYPINAEKVGDSLLMKLQNAEYAKVDTIHGLTDQVGATWLLHGAVYAGRIADVRQALLSHNAIFHAEDVRTALLLASDHKKVRLSSHVFTTHVPQNFWELAEQRINSWNWGAKLEIGRIGYNFLSVWQGPSSFLLARKLSEINALYTLLTDWIRLPLMILTFRSSTYFPLLAIQLSLLLLWNYDNLKNHPALQSDYKTIIAMPAYQHLQQLFDLVAFVKYILIYLPNADTSYAIQKGLEKGEFDFLQKYIPHYTRQSTLQRYSLLASSDDVSAPEALEHSYNVV